MKNIISLVKLQLFALLLLATGCSKEEVFTYGEESQVYFQFSRNDTPIDSISVLFAYSDKEKTDSVISIPITTMSRPYPYDREVDVRVVDSLTTGKEGIDFELIEAVVKENKVRGNVVLRILRTDLIKDKTLRLGLTLVENEHFGTKLNKMPDIPGRHLNKEQMNLNPLLVKVYFNDIFSRPLGWVLFEDRFSFAFGEYSTVKFKLILDLCNTTHDYFTFTESKVFVQRFPIPTVFTWNAIINNYLRDYEKEHGTPLKDEHGKVVTMPHPYV